LLKAVEHLSRGEIAEGVALLEQQDRVTEIADPQQRIAAIARSYAANPDNTIVVSPDNASIPSLATNTITHFYTPLHIPIVGVTLQAA
jgi:hypothetical protein